MIRTRKKYCIWALAATFGLLSALNLGSLHAADVKWHPGAQQRRVGKVRTETVSVGKYQLTSQGYAVPGWVLIGWSNRRTPPVKTRAVESQVQPLYRLGTAFDFSQDTTLYAVWAIDQNNDGTPDYRVQAGQLPLDPVWIQKRLDELEAKRRAAEGGTAHHSSLRSAPVSLPKWDINDDILAYKDKVYFVGCTYNGDTVAKHRIRENIISWNYNWNAFGKGNKDSIYATRDMELVFEYGGVLEDTCLVGGRPKDAQKKLRRIPFPKGTPPSDSKVSDLFMYDPLQFTEIKEDGEAVLKMYFVKAGTDTLANDTSYWSATELTNSWRFARPDLPKLYPHPFYNPETGEPSDTFTVRFQIYNEPKFAATSINTDILYGDTIYLKYAHLSGTPTKYMMRSFDGGWNWHPANSPLTDVERDLLQGDSVRVCLRQLDKEVGYAANLKAGYLDSERFNRQEVIAGHGASSEELSEFTDECAIAYIKAFYDKAIVAGIPEDTIAYYHDSDMGLTPAWGTLSDKEKFGKTGHFQQILDEMLPPPAITPPTREIMNRLQIAAADYDNSKLDAAIDAKVDRDFNTVFGQRLADAIPTPAWCRNEPYCFYVRKGAVPIIERTVFIPRVEGVTVLTPELGQNSVRSQKDFTFRLKYAGKPMKVIAKRMIDGRVIGEVTGTPNADGEYEYLIRRVMQDITLEFTSADANTLVDQPSVWAYGGALRIRSPKETTVRIYSASGLLVKQVAVHGDTTVPLSAGLYMVVLSDGTTHKVIVQ